MNISTGMHGLNEIANGLKKFGETLAVPAAQAAADTLVTEINQTRGANNPPVSVEQKGEGARRMISVSDAESIAREFGTLEQDATPWLAPALPVARNPMRAAVLARMLSALRLNIR